MTIKDFLKSIPEEFYYWIGIALFYLLSSIFKKREQQVVGTEKESSENTSIKSFLQNSLQIDTQRDIFGNLKNEAIIENTAEETNLIEDNLNSVPYLLSRISAGFPSPADDYIENNLSLSELLIRNHLSTFLMKTNGDSMMDVGINDGDILVVDRSIEPKNRDIVIAILEGNLTVKRLIFKTNGLVVLKSENTAYKDIKIPESADLEIWGVVTSVIHQFVK